MSGAPHNEGTWKPPWCDCTPPAARGAGRAQAAWAPTSTTDGLLSGRVC